MVNPAIRVVVAGSDGASGVALAAAGFLSSVPRLLSVCCVLHFDVGTLQACVVRLCGGLRGWWCGGFGKYAGTPSLGVGLWFDCPWLKS